MNLYPCGDYLLTGIGLIADKVLTLSQQSGKRNRGIRNIMTNPHPKPADQNAVLASMSDFEAPARPSMEAQVTAALHDEIRILRERGLSDECIHGLLSGFNIDAKPEPTSHRWTLPLNDQLIRLIWGKASSTTFQLD